MSQRLGILGGTFDPVHLGHVGSARQVAEAFSLDRTLLVLSARPPHKPNARPAPVEHRLAMLELATCDDGRFEASDLEARRPGPSYTCDTLERLHEEDTDAELFLILGLDAYREMGTWHRPADVLALAHVIVTSRPGATWGSRLPPPVAGLETTWYDPAIRGYRHPSGHRVVLHGLDDTAVSASEIRRRLGSGLAIDHLVHPAVDRYIRDHELYGTVPR